jgi:uncharacterized membrane protein
VEGPSDGDEGTGDEGAGESGGVGMPEAAWWIRETLVPFVILGVPAVVLLVKVFRNREGISDKRNKLALWGGLAVLALQAGWILNLLFFFYSRFMRVYPYLVVGLSALGPIAAIGGKRNRLLLIANFLLLLLSLVTVIRFYY